MKNWTVLYETTDFGRRRSAVLSYERVVAILFDREGQRLLDWLDAHDWREELVINGCVLNHAPKNQVEIFYNGNIVVLVPRDRLRTVANYLIETN